MSKVLIRCTGNQLSHEHCCVMSEWLSRDNEWRKSSSVTRIPRREEGGGHWVGVVQDERDWKVEEWVEQGRM